VHFHQQLIAVVAPRRRGLTSASWLRSIILEALDRSASTPPSSREAA
jgi:hypothetical protein